ncbi:MAG TPA: choice-of-anchor tandem repeat GloVer-containing protein [Rhizomicrobium sp.]|jgi:uncharacterized repeat protein (TIGR03803 family)|nr:choice-of-anchor tandem repeat GloVer-containing protein [Rhizomicrobium sp.]
MNASLFRTALLGSVLIVALSAGGAQAESPFKVLHSFAGGSSDGASPFGGVAPAGDGGFYVATDGGGSSNRGTLSLLHKDGTTQILHTFTGGTDGQNADGTPLVYAFDGTVNGTTQFGGLSGCGTTYQYNPASGAYQQLHAYGCGEDGAFPYAGLTLVKFSNEGEFFAGTTYNGGDSDDGQYFLVEAGQCSFSGSNGKNPFASVLQTSEDGPFYMVTTAGGSANLGVIVSTAGSCAINVLHSFAGGSDGAAPYGSLIYANHALYGTTASGGAGTNLGTVFKINLDGSGYSILHVFQGICCGNADGSFPRSGLTLNKKNGLLYGTTINGGNSSDDGTVFSIDPNAGTETVVHSFSGSDGAHPYGNLYIRGGTIFGTTVAGGASNLGTVFRLKT